jgi:Soluble lytic murein transglycosylase and related regulatory proteins (some contain LysM/invasin domains)
MVTCTVKRYLWALNAFLCILCIHSTTSYSAEYKGKAQVAPSEKKAGIQSSRDLLSVDYSETDLELSLLGTITREGLGTAIIKNTFTGELQSYAEGEIIDIVETEKVKLVQISDCVIMIQRGKTYETLSCMIASPVAYPTTHSPLSKYRIVDGSDSGRTSRRIAGKLLKDKNKIHRFKSEYEKDILDASEKHGVDPYLVEAIIKVESGFNPNAVSPKKAMGIMQLMPETAQIYGVGDPFDPKANIDGGVRFLKDLIDYFNGNTKLALAAYNAVRGQ